MRIDARGLTFEVTAAGPADGEPVLLLHGFPQNRRSWDLVEPALTEAGLRTYALDLRGYSPGARPEGVASYRNREYVLDAIAVLDALHGPDAAAHVVGHDTGAMVAWQLAAEHPARVRTLTAVSVPHPAAFGRALLTDDDQRRRSGYITLFRVEGKAEEVLLDDGAARLRDLLADVGAERVDRYADPMREPGALTGALNWYRAMSNDELGAIGPVAAPTTFVWSDHDIAVGPVAARGCGDHVTGDFRFVTLSGVSHWIPDEAPAALAEAVLTRIETADTAETVETAEEAARE